MIKLHSKAGSASSLDACAFDTVVSPKNPCRTYDKNENRVVELTAAGITQVSERLFVLAPKILQTICALGRFVPSVPPELARETVSVLHERRTSDEQSLALVELLRAKVRDSLGVQGAASIGGAAQCHFYSTEQIALARALLADEVAPGVNHAKVDWFLKPIFSKLCVLLSSSVFGDETELAKTLRHEVTHLVWSSKGASDERIMKLEIGYDKLWSILDQSMLKDSEFANWGDCVEEMFRNIGYPGMRDMPCEFWNQYFDCIFSAASEVAGAREIAAMVMGYIEEVAPAFPRTQYIDLVKSLFEDYTREATAFWGDMKSMGLVGPNSSMRRLLKAARDSGE